MATGDSQEHSLMFHNPHALPEMTEFLTPKNTVILELQLSHQNL